MMRKTRIAIAAAIVFGSASTALADGAVGYNPLDRWPNPVMASQQPPATFNARNSVMNWTSQIASEKALFDRASRTVDGGF